MTTRVHHLKARPGVFRATWVGSKPFELRVMDRDFQVGHTIIQREWDGETEAYSGMWMAHRITFILRPGEYAGLERGYGILGLKPMPLDSAEMPPEDVPPIPPELLTPLRIPDPPDDPDPGPSPGCETCRRLAEVLGRTRARLGLSDLTIRLQAAAIKALSRGKSKVVVQLDPP